MYDLKKILGVISTFLSVIIFIGLLIAWTKKPELTGIQFMLKNMGWYIFGYVLLVIGSFVRDK
jgi:hypothetical protein